MVNDARAKVPGYPASTVFYEFYWAFHYRDTKPALVIRWVGSSLWKLFKTGQLRKLGRRVISVVVSCVAVLGVFLSAVFLVARGI